MADATDPTAPLTEEETNATAPAIEDFNVAATEDGQPQDPSPDAQAFSSLTVTEDECAASNDNEASEPQAPAQQLPLNLPHMANLDDAGAAQALDNEFLSLLPPCILPRIDKLKSLNEKRTEILEEYRIERAKLELKFSERMRPLYVERSDVVNGKMDGEIAGDDKKDKVDDAPKEVEEGVVEDVSDEEDNDNEQVAAADGQDVKGIPQFWACAMGHVDVVAELITEADVDCLDHLTDITCTDFPDGLGFELTFHFSPNAFFTNTTLTKRYEVPNLLTEDEPILKNVTGTTINWKNSQALTFTEVTKKQRKKGGPNAGQVRTITKKERAESFFHFFTPPKMPALVDVMDEEEADAVEEAFDHDYDVAQAFRGHLIPKAVLWFTGEAMMEDFDEEMMDEMMAGEGGGDTDQQQFTFNPGSDGSPFPPPAEGDGENPECKQN